MDPCWGGWPGDRPGHPQTLLISSSKVANGGLVTLQVSWTLLTVSPGQIIQPHWAFGFAVHKMVPYSTDRLILRLTWDDKYQGITGPQMLVPDSKLFYRGQRYVLKRSNTCWKEEFFLFKKGSVLFISLCVRVLCTWGHMEARMQCRTSRNRS